uniref:Uncharacterized protein n=1 Tax=Cacopsylla melanoneura TaxID=428564 RepID=A0A8D8S9V1_9HEMI
MCFFFGRNYWTCSGWHWGGKKRSRLRFARQGMIIFYFSHNPRESFYYYVCMNSWYLMSMQCVIVVGCFRSTSKIWDNIGLQIILQFSDVTGANIKHKGRRTGCTRDSS